MDVEIKKRYEFCQQLIQKVGKTALSFYLNRDSLEIQCKEGEKLDLVSIADQTVEKEIKATLKEHFPDDGFLGEESGADNLDHEFCWVVDPIDGTNPFLFGLHAWCISIAIIRNNQVVAGTIYDPQHNELFHAALGQGAYLNEKRIQVRNAVSLKDGLVGLGMSHRTIPQTLLSFLPKILTQGGMFVRNGSGALTLAHVAAGRLIAYFEPHIKAWDCLAGIILVKEAGGETNDFLANNGLLEGNYILASGKAIFNQLDSFRNN